MTHPSSILALALAAALASGPAWAGHPQNGQKGKPGNGDAGRLRVEVRFDEPQQAAVRSWYAKQIGAGRCPPGLAKKHNGCLPPGQAKKRWTIGRPLPREVIFYNLPPTLVVELGVPPPGYRFVRVANDLLLIAIGTGMVLDAVTDLGRM